MITEDDEEEMHSLKSHFSGEFEVKDLGILCYFLGIKVTHPRKGIFISQRKYIIDLLTEIVLLGARPTKTPIEVNHRLND